MAQINEPNGKAVFKFAFLTIIRPMPHKAPAQIEKIIENIPKGNPRMKPIRKESFTSPKPIHSPFDTTYIIAKKASKPKPVNNPPIRESAL